MAKFLAMAIPILPGMEADWKRWHHELTTTRHLDFIASRKRLGVRERTFLQHNPTGDLVIVTLKGDDPAGAFAQFGKGEDEFTKWFKEGVLRLHGIDMNEPFAGPMPEMMLDSKV